MPMRSESVMWTSRDRLSRDNNRKDRDDYQGWLTRSFL